MGARFKNKKGAQKMTCFFCKGDLVKGTTTYTVNFGNSVAVIKNVPCTECSQCGESFLDDDVMMQIEEIVKGLKDIMTEVAVIDYSNKVA